jgi:hypothetical protein
MKIVAYPVAGKADIAGCISLTYPLFYKERVCMDMAHKPE